MNTVKTAVTVQELANAYKTLINCNGHHKADMNRLRVNEYKWELEKRGISIPTNDELLQTGVFNGQGSY